MSKIVERTLDFIELFAAERRPLSLSDISRLLHIPVSSCHDVLQALQARGFLYEIGPRAGYYPTRRLYELSQVIVTHDPIIMRAEMLLRNLRDHVDELVSLAKTSGLQATYILVFEPSHPLRFLVSVGSTIRSLHATSAGKALLGSLSPEAFDDYLKSARLTPMTNKTITSKSALREDIEKSIKRGWFLNREESVEDATTISANFKWNGATFIVTVAGPTARMKGKLDRVTHLLKEICGQLGTSGPA